MGERFEKHARTVSLLTLASRMTGLVRDAALSRVFGAGAVADAFLFAFIIPNLFRRLFGEGAIAAAFLPVFSRAQRDDPDMARRLATLMIGSLAVGLGAIVIVGELVLWGLSHRVDHGNPSIWLTMVMLPYMPLVCIVAILGAMLQVHGRFGPTAAAPIVLNACLIITILAGASFVSSDLHAAHGRLVHVGIVAGSVVVAGLLQVAWSWLALRDQRWWVSDVRQLRTAREPLKRVGRHALPMILGLGVLQLNTLFDALIANYPNVVGPTIFGAEYPLESGAMSAVGYAQRLYQFPLGVFGIAVATAIFPALAALADDRSAFVETVRRGIRLVVFIGLPAACGLILVRAPLTRVVLEGGAFGPDDTARVGFVLLGYAPAIWAYSMVHVLTRAFYAQGDSMTPVRIAVAVVLLNLTLNCSLIWTPLRESGLAWSTAVCSIVQVTCLAVSLRRRWGALLDPAVLGSWGRTLGASALMTVVVWIAFRTLAGTFGDTWIGSLGYLGTLVIIGAATFAAAARAMRMPELRWAVAGRR